MTPQTRITDPAARQLQRALAPYIDLPTLRRLVADYGQQTEGAALDVRSALLAPDAEQPAEVRMLLDVLTSMLRPFERIQIRQPADIAAFLMADMGQLEQEEMRVMYLSTKAEVIGVETVYRGQIDRVDIRAAELFRPAIRANAADMILAHNHPSGSIEISEADEQITRRLVAMGEELGITILDHLIIGRGRWASMRQRGIGFERLRFRTT